MWYLYGIYQQRETRVAAAVDTLQKIEELSCRKSLLVIVRPSFYEWTVLGMYLRGRELLEVVKRKSSLALLFPCGLLVS